MANGFRGEATFAFDGKTFTLVYDANAFCEIEDALSTPDHQVGMKELMALMQTGMSMKAFRAIVAGGLRKHHKMSPEEAGDLISDAGFELISSAVGDAVGKAMPDLKATPKGNAAAPNRAQRRRAPKAGAGAKP